MRRLLIWAAVCLSLYLAQTPWVWAGADPLAELRSLNRASLLLREGGQDRIALEPDTPRIPASTLKLLTAYAALKTWGRDHRFITELFQDRSGWLWVRGSGDPYLVSEELERLAQALRAQGLKQVAGIGLDDGLFDPELALPGREGSNNPYDAPVTALAANFNTLSLIRKDQAIQSAEHQTPLTPTAARIGQGLLAAGAFPEGAAIRVNLGERKTALAHFAELLAAKLIAAGIAVGQGQRIGPVPADARLILRYQNAHTLAEVVAAMLKYSNNFIANALFLGLAAPEGRGPVDLNQAQQAMAAFVRDQFGWQDAVILEGAGLARANRLSARQLVELLEAFAPYRDLMPEQTDDPRVRAKTGTLSGVSCYAGYVRRDGIWAPFALLIEQPIEPGLRLRIASWLAR